MSVAASTAANGSCGTVHCSTSVESYRTVKLSIVSWGNGEIHAVTYTSPSSLIDRSRTSLTDMCGPAIIADQSCRPDGLYLTVRMFLWSTLPRTYVHPRESTARKFPMPSGSCAVHARVGSAARRGVETHIGDPRTTARTNAVFADEDRTEARVSSFICRTSSVDWGMGTALGRAFYAAWGPEELGQDHWLTPQSSGRQREEPGDAPTTLDRRQSKLR